MIRGCGLRVERDDREPSAAANHHRVQQLPEEAEVGSVQRLDLEERAVRIATLQQRLEIGSTGALELIAERVLEVNQLTFLRQGEWRRARDDP